MKSRHQCCATCRFYKVWPGVTVERAGRPEDVGKGMGDCHRYPPTVVTRPGKIRRGEDPAASINPITIADNFCGEYEAMT